MLFELNMSENVIAVGSRKHDHLNRRVLWREFIWVRVGAVKKDVQ